MEFKFSEKPGRHERHLKRIHQNPLFRSPPEPVSDQDIFSARQQDEQELQQFIQNFQGLVEEAAGLKANEDAEVILSLKERLDQSYEQAAGLLGDQTPVLSGIIKLLQLIMSAMRSGAGQDQKAHEELDQEEIARADHFRLLSYPIVADILDPKSKIGEDELLPSLLSESAESLAAALQLFDAEQIDALIKSGEALFEKIGSENYDLTQARQNLDLIKAQSKHN